MIEDEATRGLPTFPPTYTLRDGAPVCTTCGKAGAEILAQGTIGG